MSFSFPKPVIIYGVILGNCNEMGWGGQSYCEGSKIQVKLVGDSEYSTAHTISGFSIATRTAYMAVINKQNVVEVKIQHTSYFAFSYVRFV